MRRLYPSLLRGSATLAPSGKFCSPIPSARMPAPTRVEPGTPMAAPPKATPTAMPSGMLCRVTALTSRMLRLRDALLPAAAVTKLDLSSSLSATIMNRPPVTNPRAGRTHWDFPSSPHSSMAGARSDQKLAAIITPAPKPSMILSTFLFTSRKKKTTAAPRAVMAQVKRVARSPCTTGFMFSKNSTVFPPNQNYQGAVRVRSMRMTPHIQGMRTE